MVRSLLQEELGADRISYKDTTRYFSITVDNKANHWICRFYLSPKKKQMETKVELESLEDIYHYKDLLLEIAGKYRKESKDERERR